MLRLPGLSPATNVNVNEVVLWQKGFKALWINTRDDLARIQTHKTGTTPDALNRTTLKRIRQKLKSAVKGGIQYAMNKYLCFNIFGLMRSIFSGSFLKITPVFTAGAVMTEA